MTKPNKDFWITFSFIMLNATCFFIQPNWISIIACFILLVLLWITYRLNHYITDPKIIKELEDMSQNLANELNRDVTINLNGEEKIFKPKDKVDIIK